MTKKIGDKKVGGVKSTKETTSIEETSSVSGADSVAGVKSIKATGAVGGVGSAGAVGKRRPTRAMTFAERQELFKLVNEEAEKMVKSGLLPAKKREVVEGAVKMAIDSGLIDEGGEKKK